jgi:hypothetical protein
LFLSVGEIPFFIVTLLEQKEILTPVSSIADKSATSIKCTARRSDHELQLARRIDWRFLLPEPYLRRVVYLGPEPGALPDALKHFSESLRINAVEKNGSFDLVVLRLREASSLAKADALLVPGGFLYWEMKPVEWAVSLQNMMKRILRLLPRSVSGVFYGSETEWTTDENKENGLVKMPHKPRFSTETKNGSRGKGAGLQKNVLDLFHDHVAALERLGFGDIRIYWQRPNFEACLEIIPMNDPVALDYAFSRPRSDWASRLKFAAGRMMMQTGLLAHLTPCFSLIARKRARNE